jgi:aspartate racemase
MLQAIDQQASPDRFDLVCEEPADFGQLGILDETASLAERGVTSVVLPWFESLEFLGELQKYSPLPVADMLEALVGHVHRAFPTLKRVGVLTSDSLRRQGVFERYFSASAAAVLHPRAHIWDDSDHCVQAARAACADLIEQGAGLIIPATVKLIPMVPRFALTVPVLDVHSVYAQHIATQDAPPPHRPFKLGVVGGVGPAATVDFLRKLISNTAAHRDQDHLKVLVEQNPQIPDRTDYLLGKGTDPTLALYATCRKLQAGDADVIAIPCNTAHAFIDSIQPHLDIPIINMLGATVSHIRQRFPTLQEAGLLATSGTLASGIYHHALQKQGLRELVPPPALQERLMRAIYGESGIKAGFTSGPCVDEIHSVIDELVSRGVQVVILGCTELPLVLTQHEITSHCGDRVTLIDPTEILALRCIAQAGARTLDAPL